jgi:LPXTG-motif cell wall-anchored protein
VALPVTGPATFTSSTVPALPSCPEPSPLPEGTLTASALTWMASHPATGSPSGPTWPASADAFAVLTAARLGVGSAALPAWLTPLTDQALAAGSTAPSLAGLAVNAAVAAGDTSDVAVLVEAMRASITTAAASPTTTPSATPHPSTTTHAATAASTGASGPPLPHTGADTPALLGVGGGLLLAGAAALLATRRPRRLRRPWA